MRVSVKNTTLKIMAGAGENLSRLVREEEAVIRNYARQVKWPHKSVTMFVCDDFQLHVSEIEEATMTSLAADDIDHRPIINVYSGTELADCMVFINRLVLEREGIWDDPVALRALLAHEHGHALAENETVHAARSLSVQVITECEQKNKAVIGMLRLLANHLCVRAPHEVFAREIAIRAGFGDSLLHLNRTAVERASLRVSKRKSLALGLDKQVADSKLSAAERLALLLVGDLHALSESALETAPLLRAKHRQAAEALETALISGVLSHLDPAALGLYRNFRDHYLQLRPDLPPEETQHWCITALDLLRETLRETDLRVRLMLVRAQSNGESHRYFPRKRGIRTRRSPKYRGDAP